MYYFLSNNYDSKNKAILSENEYDRDICDNCGAIYVTYKGIFKFKIMGKPLDYYMVSGTPVISERFLNVLRENGFTGFEVSETAPRYGTVTMAGDKAKEKYYLLKVTGKCGMIKQLNGDLFPYCKKCHRKIASTGLVTTGVTFAESEYDGSDIFAFENLDNIPIVSEEIRDVLLKSKLTNLSFVALDEWEYSDQILKSSVIRRFEKGSVYPELIEAWLKYGVLTEHELNEQQNKRR